MVDKDGKVGGKINLIDLIIIIILIALAALAIWKFAVPKDKNAGAVPVKITLFCEETPDYVVDYIKEGAPVYDSKEDITLGTVTSFTTGDPIGYERDESDTMYQVVRPNYKSVKIEVEVKGVMGANGVTVDDVLYGVGHTMTVYAGESKMYVKVMGIEPDTSAVSTTESPVAVTATAAAK